MQSVLLKTLKKLVIAGAMAFSFMPSAPAFPDTGESFQIAGWSMRTTSGQRGTHILARYDSSFRDSVVIEGSASKACARSELHPAKLGQFKVVFNDRIIEGGVHGSITDPNGLIRKETVYVFKNLGSTNCTVWRVAR